MTTNAVPVCRSLFVQHFPNTNRLSTQPVVSNINQLNSSSSPRVSLTVDVVLTFPQLLLLAGPRVATTALIVCDETDGQVCVCAKIHGGGGGGGTRADGGADLQRIDRPQSPQLAAVCVCVCVCV